MLKFIVAIAAVILFYLALAPAVENVRLCEDLRIARSIVAVTRVQPAPRAPFKARPGVKIKKGKYVAGK